MCVCSGNSHVGPVPGPQNLTEHRDPTTQQNGPVSVIYRPFTSEPTYAQWCQLCGPSTRAYEHVWKRVRWHKNMKNLLWRMWIGMQRLAQADVYTEVRYESIVWGWEECSSFDMIRMVSKTMDKRPKEKEIKELRSWMTPKEVEWFWSGQERQEEGEGWRWRKM